MDEIDIPFSSIKPEDSSSLADSTATNYSVSNSYQNLYESSTSSMDSQNFVSKPLYALQQQDNHQLQRNPQEVSNSSEEQSQKFFDNMAPVSKQYLSSYNSLNVPSSSYLEYNTQESNEDKNEHCLKKDFNSQVLNEQVKKSPTALQDPSTISLHSTDLEPHTSTSSPLSTAINMVTNMDDQKTKLTQLSKVVQRFEPSPPQRLKDFWYDVGVFIENKCFVTYFTLPPNENFLSNQEV